MTNLITLDFAYLNTKPKEEKTNETTSGLPSKQSTHKPKNKKNDSHTSRANSARNVDRSSNPNLKEGK